MVASNGDLPIRPLPPAAFEQVVSNGEAWKLSHITPGIRKAFAAWVQLRAMERLHEAREWLSKEEYAKREQRLYDRIEAGDYDWGCPLDPDNLGEAVLRARLTGEGNAKLAQLLLEPFHGTVEPGRIAAAFQGNIKGFQVALRRCLDPNSDSPSVQNGQGEIPQSPTQTETQTAPAA